LYGLREIGREALCWQLSSAKPGNGVEQIRDQSTDTYWQSDGVSQPHWIQVHFARRVAISHVCLYLDYNLDESYTPKSLSVQVGMTTQDLVPAVYPANTVVEFNEPVGWCIIPLTAPPDPLDDEDEDIASEQSRSRRIVRTHLVQIQMISMHQNGRDTHIRQVQLYGPRSATMIPTFQKEPSDPNSTTTNDLKRRHLDEEFSTVAMSQFSVIR
jgi:anaphase-promoting complex subunit 10